MVDNRSNEPHDFVSLMQMNARCARFLPQEADRVEPKDADAFFEVQPNDLQEFQQHFRVGKVEVDLIVAERASQLFDAVMSFR